MPKLKNSFSDPRPPYPLDLFFCKMKGLIIFSKTLRSPTQIHQKCHKSNFGHRTTPRYLMRYPNFSERAKIRESTGHFVEKVTNWLLRRFEKCIRWNCVNLISVRCTAIDFSVFESYTEKLYDQEITIHLFTGCFFYDFTTLILHFSKSLTAIFINSSGMLEYLVGLQINLVSLGESVHINQN